VNNSGFGGPGGFFGFPGGAPQTAGAAADGSVRQSKLGRVAAVADRRTASIVVTAAKSMMPQIAAMIENLDGRADRKQRIYAVALNYAHPVDVQQILQDLIPASSSAKTSASASSTQSNPFTTRATTLLNQQTTTTSTGFGSSAGGSGAGGTAGR
jgi:hypothetical protein